MSYRWDEGPPVTLPVIRHCPLPQEPPKLTGGDLHRMHAPKPVDQPRFEAFHHANKPRRRRAPSPTKPVMGRWKWTEVSTALCVMMHARGETFQAIADALNREFVEKGGYGTTRSAVKAKLARMGLTNVRT